MKSFFDINNEMSYIIKTPEEKRKMNNRRKYLLSLNRPFTLEENEEFNKISSLIQLQNEIDIHNKKRNKYLKNVLTNEGIFII